MNFLPAQPVHIAAPHFVFFVKDYLNLSAAFLASLGFWAGIPWVLKMPLGHLVDLIWSRKNYLVFFSWL